MAKLHGAGASRARALEDCPETIEQQADRQYKLSNLGQPTTSLTSCSAVVAKRCQGVLLTVQPLLRRDVLNAACVSKGKPRGRPKTLLVRCSFDAQTAQEVLTLVHILTYLP